MSTIELIVNIIIGMYKPWDIIFGVLFFYAPSFLRTLTVSCVLILSIGKILSLLKRKFYQVIKWIIYIWFFGYSLYALGVFGNLLELKNLKTIDWMLVIFSILAPICLAIVGRQVGSAKIKGHKIFVYYVIMLIYLLLAILWVYYYPEGVIFEFLLLYWVLAVFFVSIVCYLKGG